MNEPDEFGVKTKAYFEHVNSTIFAGDPAANEHLAVEVVGETTALDTPILVLITPWTLAGLARPPDGRFPKTIKIGANHFPVLGNQVDAIGSYLTVILIPDVSSYTSQEAARAEAKAFAGKFRSAVEKARIDLTDVEAPELRALFKGQGVRTETVADADTAFGDPNAPSKPKALDV